MVQSVWIGKCSQCDKPGVGAINANANAGALAAPVWEVRCDEHNPYWNSTPGVREARRVAELTAVLEGLVAAVVTWRADKERLPMRPSAERRLFDQLEAAQAVLRREQSQ